MPRVALYARVSTDEQADGYSIGAQLKAMHEYAQRQGWDVFAAYVDEGESARTDKRPRFQLMVAAAKRKPRPFDIILVHKFDRFARNRDDSAVYKSLFRKECGIEVRSVSEQTDSSPSGRLLEGVLEVVAEFYSHNLSHEVLKGQRERALQGKAMAPPPIGYVTGPDGRYQPDPNTAPIVRWLFTEYAAGSEGYRNLARSLRQEGRLRFGPAADAYSWTDAYVQKILANPVYCGTYIWGRRDSSRQWRERDRSEWVIVEDAHEPLVSREVFARVQQLRRSRRGVRRAGAGKDYLLRGLARCLDCNARAIKHSARWHDRRTAERRERTSLLCGAYSKGKGCYCNRVPMDRVEQIVLGYLCQILTKWTGPDQIEIGRSEPPVDAATLRTARRRLEALNKKLARLMDAYAAEVIGLAELKTGRERVLAERQALEEQIERLEAPGTECTGELGANDITPRVQALFAAGTDSRLDISQRRQALEQIVGAVHYSKREGLIKIAFRLSPCAAVRTVSTASPS